MGCRKGLSQPRIEFVSGVCGLAFDLKSKLRRSQGGSWTLVLNDQRMTATVLSGLASMEQFVLVGCDSMSTLGEHFILSVSQAGQRSPHSALP